MQHFIARNKCTLVARRRSAATMRTRCWCFASCEKTPCSQKSLFFYWSCHYKVLQILTTCMRFAAKVEWTPIKNNITATNPIFGNHAFTWSIICIPSLIEKWRIDSSYLQQDFENWQKLSVSAGEIYLTVYVEWTNDDVNRSTLALFTEICSKIDFCFFVLIDLDIWLLGFQNYFIIHLCNE